MTEEEAKIPYTDAETLAKAVEKMTERIDPFNDADKPYEVKINENHDILITYRGKTYQFKDDVEWETMTSDEERSTQEHNAQVLSDMLISPKLSPAEIKKMGSKLIRIFIKEVLDQLNSFHLRMGA